MHGGTCLFAMPSQLSLPGCKEVPKLGVCGLAFKELYGICRGFHKVIYIYMYMYRLIELGD